MNRIAIIGSGFSGLSAACYLTKAGYAVDVYEKNESVGGRARQLTTLEGFVFDMGPSWYWMPEVFEHFFNDFGHSAQDFYTLLRLNPAFDIMYENNSCMSIPDKYEDLKMLFENTESGSGARLDAFMAEAKEKYTIAMTKFVTKPSNTLWEYFSPDIAVSALKLHLLSSQRKLVRKYFKHLHLVALMEFPVLFLGAMPQDIPAMYSFMNYAGLSLGTWYPMGGFGKVCEAMMKIAMNQGATFYMSTAVQKIEVSDKKVHSVLSTLGSKHYDAVVAAADYAHVESQLLEAGYRNYDDAYWQKQTFAPSCLLYYLGINKRIPNLHHHTLFFDEDLDTHAVSIYKNPEWPVKPLFYVCCPSQSDATVAPDGYENIFLLMPLAAGLQDDDEAKREKYFNIMLDRLETKTSSTIRPHIVYKKSYCTSDFIQDYNAYKGNAYGLANTLMQTAFLKPKLKNKKVENLFYCGQLSVPGPGVPPSIISGKIVATELQKYFTHKS